MPKNLKFFSDISPKIKNNPARVKVVPRLFRGGKPKRLVVFAIILLCLFFVLPCFYVFAEPDYGISVAGVEVTEQNKDDILGDGSVSFDPVLFALTLKDAAIEGEVISEKSLEIVLYGKNTVSSESDAIVADGGLKFTGGGGLTVNSPENGIFVRGKLVFEHSGVITVNGGKTAVSNEDGGVEINSGVVIAIGSAEGESYGIYCKNGGFSQTSGILAATGKRAGIFAESESGGDLITISDRVLVKSGGSIVGGRQDGAYWEAFSEKSGSGKDPVTPDDASKTVSTTKLLFITAEGDNLYITAVGEKALPQSVEPGTSLNFIVFSDSGYKPGKDFYVQINGQSISPTGGVYKIDDIQSDIFIKAGGMILDTPTPEKPKGFFAKLGKGGIILAVFGLCLAAGVVYVVLTSRKEEKSKAENTKNKGKNKSKKKR